MPTKKQVLKKKSLASAGKVITKRKVKTSPENQNKKPDDILTPHNIKVLTEISKRIADKIKDKPEYRKKMISLALKDPAIKEVIIKRTAKKIFR